MDRIKNIFVPSRAWRVRIFSLYVFIFFDYSMTALFCRAFSEEGNIFLRYIMIQLNDIIIGLVFFTLAFYGSFYALLSYLSNNTRLNYTGLKAIIFSYRRPIFDIVLGLGVAARHFEGGMSWVLPLHNRLWLALGFVAYLSLVHIGTFQMLK